jgi:hypothetical protein
MKLITYFIIKELSKAEIARYLNKEVNASKAELVQFFHSTFYKEGLNEDKYVSSFISFQTELNTYLEENKNWGMNDTFLKDKPFTTTKIPVKVLKQMEQDYKEAQAYIDQTIKEINE